MAKAKSCWGDVSLALDEVKTWSLGERKIAIQRLPKEWGVWNTDSESTSQITVTSLKSASTFSDVSYSRHLVNLTTDTIHISPMLADRPIVARPATSLNILLGEYVELYIRSPLWIFMKLNTMYQEIKKAFDRFDIEIPFPHISIYSGATMKPMPITSNTTHPISAKPENDNIASENL
jgi:hypothetical protein